MTKNTFSVTYKVRNTDIGTAISPIETKVSGKVRNGSIVLPTNAMQALGFALENLWLFLAGNTQFKTCEIEIEGMVIDSKYVRMLQKQGRAAFELNFPILREGIAGDLAVTFPEVWGKGYMRDTDRNGVFKNTKTFSTDQIAAQVVERAKMVRFVTKLVKEDAADSVWDSALKAKQLQITAKRKEERKLALIAAAKA